jgi:predicted homoserine dehydrogenase-like protein
VIVEATGEVEFGSQVVTRAIDNGKHVILVNAELDSTLGPILKVRADKKGVMYAQADGDQPAVLMNLYRQAKGWGFTPVMVGNIKSLLDVRRTPETQAKWAEEHYQRPKMVTSFADGTKIGAENASIANATGFPVSMRGMEGPKCDRVENAYKLFDIEKLKTTGLTDYILGAEPSFGVFVLATCDNPIRARYMSVYKMGDGPLYTFYVPYHLSPIEAPMSVARAVIFKDAALKPLGAPVCDVVSMAKRDIKKGETLDGIGGFLTYGTIDNHDVCERDNLLPIGLADGCVATQDIPMDTAITYAMVDF